MTLNAAEIRELALAATPGPWSADAGSVYTLGDTVLGGTIADVNFDQQTGDHQPHGDLQLLAYFDPVKALQIADLLDRLLELADGPTTLAAQDRLKNLLVGTFDVVSIPSAKPAEEPHPTAVPLDWGTVVEDLGPVLPDDCTCEDREAQPQADGSLKCGTCGKTIARAGEWA